MSQRTKLCLIGLATTAVGLVPVLASFDVIASDDADFGAPRWFVAAIGLCFVLVGMWLALTRAPDAGPLTRTAFVALAVVFAMLAAHGLWRAVAALGRRPRP